MTAITIIIFLLILIVSVEAIRLIWLGLITKYLAKKATRFEQTTVGGSGSILIVGDSLAYGTGASTPENSLVGRLARDYKQFTIKNRAENGANVKKVIRQLENVGDEKFSVVLIFIGGIDTLALTKINKIKRRLQRLYQLANQVSTGRVIHVSVNNTGLVPMLRFPLNLLYSSRSRKISNLSQTLSKQYNVLNIPLFTEKKDDPLHGNQDYYAKDKIHPNDQGYEIWYKEIVQVIKPSLESISTNPKSR